MSDAASGRTGPGRPLGVAGALLLALVVGSALLVDLVRERRLTRDAFPVARGRIEVEALGARVTIDRDGRGVPHIEAASERDALFALGFVHAQDRLTQMQWRARLARGRAAEVLGPSYLEADRRARLLGLGALADAQLPRLSRTTRRALEAYAAGVNARIERVRRGDVGPPLALKELGLPLDPWRAEDSLAVFKLHAWGLESTVDASLVLSDLIRSLGAADARRFFPGFPNGGMQDAAPQPTIVRSPPPARRPVTPGDPLRRALGLQGRSVGSSAWIVGGLHTESGRPILVADHHLEATAPPGLYLAQLRGGGFAVAGASLPGVPVFFSGHNGHVAWAGIHARAVVTDLYIETLDPGGDDRFHDGRRWRDLVVRSETIRVAGGDDVVMRVRETRHGPLLPDAEGREPLSIAWSGARIDGPSGIGSLLGVARADSGEAILEALRDHHEPVLTVAWVDAEGEGGTKVAGWIPQRSLSPELLPLPGRARWYDWQDPVPFDALPSARLGEGRGVLVVADARPVSTDEEASHIEWLWQSGERAARIEVLLREALERGPADLRAMTALQTDVGSERPRALVRDVLALAGSDPLGPEARELAEILAGWDGSASQASVGAAAYHVFLSVLTRGLLEERLGADLTSAYLALPQVEPESLVAAIVHDATRAGAEGGFSDRARVTEVARRGLRDAWLRLSYRLGPNRAKWTWGRLHPLHFRPFTPHALASDGGLGPYPYGGSNGTVSAGGFDPESPYQVRVASTVRFAVDTVSLDQALASIAPGQSEHPDHPNHRDGIGRWLEGRSSLLASGPLLVEEASVAHLVVDPVR